MHGSESIDGWLSIHHGCLLVGSFEQTTARFTRRGRERAGDFVYLFIGKESALLQQSARRPGKHLELIALCGLSGCWKIVSATEESSCVLVRKQGYFYVSVCVAQAHYLSLLIILMKRSTSLLSSLPLFPSDDVSRLRVHIIMFNQSLLVSSFPSRLSLPLRALVFDR